MEMLFKLISNRLDVLQQTLALSETLIDHNYTGSLLELKRNLASSKKTEKALIIHEEENLQIISGRKDYPRPERLKFQKIMLEAIIRLCPQINYVTLKKYPTDGKHRSICMNFIVFFNHLAMTDKVIEIKTIYENKLYQSVPLLYLLTRWFIQVSRKIINNQFKFYSHQIKQILERQCEQKEKTSLPLKSNFNTAELTLLSNKPQSSNNSLLVSAQSCIMHKSTESSSITKNTLFKKQLKLITQVVPDATIEEIPNILYNATVKYRSIFMRNLSIKKTLDKYKTQREKQTILPKLTSFDSYYEKDMFTDHTIQSNQSFNFWFQYTYARKPISPLIELRPRSSNLYPISSSRVLQKKPIQAQVLTPSSEGSRILLPIIPQSLEMSSQRDITRSAKQLERKIDSQGDLNRTENILRGVRGSPCRFNIFTANNHNAILLRKSSLRKSIHSGSLKRQNYETEQFKLLTIIHEKAKRMVDGDSIQREKQQEVKRKDKKKKVLRTEGTDDSQIRLERLNFGRKKKVY